MKASNFHTPVLRVSGKAPHEDLTFPQDHEPRQGRDSGWLMSLIPILYMHRVRHRAKGDSADRRMARTMTMMKQLPGLPDSHHYPIRAHCECAHFIGKNTKAQRNLLKNLPGTHSLEKTEQGLLFCPGWETGVQMAPMPKPVASIKKEVINSHE